MEESWEKFESSIICQVYEHWKKVLDLIIVDHGDNRLLDLHRGSLYMPLVVPQPSQQANDDDNNGEEGSIVGSNDGDAENDGDVASVDDGGNKAAMEGNN
jgi:hypothetical protein